MSIIKDLTKGATEGIGRGAGDAAQERIKKTVEKSASTIETRLFGIGPADEAKFSLALGSLKDIDEREVIIKFLESLTKGERDWFRRAIAEMDLKNASTILHQYAQLSDNDKRKERGKASGLIKESFFERIDKIADEAAGGLKSLSDKIKKKYEGR